MNEQELCRGWSWTSVYPWHGLQMPVRLVCFFPWESLMSPRPCWRPARLPASSRPSLSSTRPLSLPARAVGRGLCPLLPVHLCVAPSLSLEPSTRSPHCPALLRQQPQRWLIFQDPRGKPFAGAGRHLEYKGPRSQTCIWPAPWTTFSVSSCP